MSLLGEIAVGTGLPLSDLARIVLTAPRRYKVYQIPKRDGTLRTIAQPSRELKIVQHFLLRNYLNKYRVHRCAMGYVKGRNILENAQTHSGDDVILKLDFKDFFPGIKADDWRRYVLRHRDGPLKKADIAITTLIFFWGMRTAEPRCLSIGAPTSPILSNILLYKLDEKLSTLADSRGVSYTRYADDITVSARNVRRILSFERAIRREVGRLRSPKLVFNDDKRGVYHSGQRRLVTGLVLTPDGNVSIGRDRKREISALLHRFSLEQLDLESVGRLKGLLGFAIANEPDFVDRMRLKYGDSVLDCALQVQLPPRRAVV